jgi:solute carrier family 25 aspartate/glutamate transporter 12/13
MEASIVFHFAGRGNAGQRLAPIDFAQLLDPRWRAPYEYDDLVASKASRSIMEKMLISVYSFVQGGE